MSRREYYVYVIELKKSVLKNKQFKEKNLDYIKGQACLYVGSSAHPPAYRFEQHLNGYKANRYAKKYGCKLRPDLYDEYNPMSTRDDAERQEEALALELRADGYAVWYGI